MPDSRAFPLDESDIIIEKGVSAGIPLWERPKGRANEENVGFGSISTSHGDED